MNDWLDIPPDEIAINLDTGEARHWDRETIARKGWDGNWKWVNELNTRDLVEILERVRQVPDVCARYHGLEPLGDPDKQEQGPYITLSGKQLRKITGLTEDTDATFRLQYMGSGYWWLIKLDADGNDIDEGHMIAAIET